jgi:hypothetical protein
VLDRGILYVTTSEINILDVEQGKPLYPKTVESGNSVVTAASGDKLYAFSHEQGALYVVDRKAGTIERVSKAKVALENGEVPCSLDVNDDNVTLVSNQSVVAFNTDGTVKFQAHHPAPRRSALVRALLAAEAVRAGMAAFASGAYGVGMASVSADQTPGSASQVVAEGFAQGFGEMAEGYAGLSRRYAQAARERFTASAASKDFVFMMVSFTKNSYGLARVSKQNGQVLEAVDMQKDKSPVYDVDSVSSQIYYRPTPNEVVSYRFQEKA